jgi:hypothetical protein
MESKTWSGTVEWMRSDYKYCSGSDRLTFWVDHGCSLMQMNDVRMGMLGMAKMKNKND